MTSTLAYLKYIRRVVRKGGCCFLFLFQSPSFSDIDSVPLSEKRIERFLEKKPYIGRIEFLVIEIVIGMYHDSAPFLAVGRYPEAESHEGTLRNRTDMLDKSAEIERIGRFLPGTAVFGFLGDGSKRKSVWFPFFCSSVGRGGLLLFLCRSLGDFSFFSIRYGAFHGNHGMGNDAPESARLQEEKRIRRKFQPSVDSFEHPEKFRIRSELPFLQGFFHTIPEKEEELL